MLQSKFFSITLWASLAVLAIFSGLSSGWPINQWSVAYLRGRLDSNLEGVKLPNPPEEHPHAGIWLAEEALLQGNLQLAQSWLPILETRMQVDVLSAHTFGKIISANGEPSKAVQIWLQIRDYQALWNSAQQLEFIGRLDDALLAYRAAYIIDPYNGTLPLANFLWWSYNDRSAADDVLNNSLNLYPEARQRRGWMYRLGEFLRWEKCWQDAENLYQTLIQEDTTDWLAYIGLGWVLYDRGDGFESAETEFQKAIALVPERGEGYFAMGQALAREGHFADAEVWFVKALQYNPENEYWLLGRANTVRSTGDFVRALQLYQELLMRFPDFAPAYYEAAHAYQLAEQPSDAITAIEQALALTSPTNTDYFIRAGNIYEWAGEKEQALKYYNHVLQIQPLNNAVIKAVERLRE